MELQIHIRSMHLPMVLSLKNTSLPAGVTVDVEPPAMRRDISEAWATAVFTVIAGIPASVIAGLLIEKLHDKKSTVVTINRKEVHLEHGEIVRVIEEAIRVEK